MRPISEITKREFIQILSIVHYSSANLDPVQWRMLDYGEEPAAAIRYNAEEYELRIIWEEGSPINIFVVAQGHFEAIEPEKLDKIQQKLQEMNFLVPVLKTWDFPVDEWDYDIIETEAS